MKKQTEKVVFKGEWLSVHESVYLNQNGQEIVWESVRRQRSKAGVVVFAKMKPSGRLILVKQYRPVLNGFIIGFPAGLSNDEPEQALVELKEETGYVGTITEISPILKSNGGIIDDGGRVVCIEVDENDPRNKNPQQELEPTEQIEVFPIHPDDAYDFLMKEYEQKTHIAANLWYLFVLSKMI